MMSLFRAVYGQSLVWWNNPPSPELCVRQTSCIYISMMRCDDDTMIMRCVIERRRSSARCAQGHGIISCVASHIYIYDVNKPIAQKTTRTQNDHAFIGRARGFTLYADSLVARNMRSKWQSEWHHLLRARHASSISNVTTSPIQRAQPYCYWASFVLDRQQRTPSYYFAVL